MGTERVAEGERSMSRRQWIGILAVVVVFAAGVVTVRKATDKSFASAEISQSVKP